MVYQGVPGDAIARPPVPQLQHMVGSFGLVSWAVVQDQVPDADPELVAAFVERAGI